MTPHDATRTAQVTRDSDGLALGVAVFLSATELTALGVDPATTDRIAVRITDDGVEVSRVSTEDSDE